MKLYLRRIDSLNRIFEAAHNKVDDLEKAVKET